MPPELPEPALGINFARDGMQEKDWISLVAVHSDAWLLAVAFYFGSRFGFDKADRYVSLYFVVDVSCVVSLCIKIWVQIFGLRDKRFSIFVVQAIVLFFMFSSV